MQDFKKAIVSTVTVFLVLVIVFAAIIIPMTPYTVNYDLKMREDMSEKTDFLIVGASHAQCSLYTRNIDKVLGCESYNISYNAMRANEKKQVLSDELKKGKIKTVVLEISYDTLYYDDVTTSTGTNMFTMLRMKSFPERFNYYRQVTLDNKFYIFSYWAHNSILSLINKCVGKSYVAPPIEEDIEGNEEDLKGSRLLPAEDRSLPESSVISSYNKQRFTVSDFDKNALSDFTSMIELCHKYNAKVILAVVPVSDNFLWCNSNLDEFDEWAKEYSKEQDASFYDFNLLKDRYELFSDEKSYSTDTHHMSGEGAKTFSTVFANTLKDAENGVDVSGEFYNSFEELKADSPYMPFYEKNK